MRPGRLVGLEPFGRPQLADVVIEVVDVIGGSKHLLRALGAQVVGVPMVIRDKGQGTDQHRVEKPAQIVVGPLTKAADGQRGKPLHEVGSSGSAAAGGLFVPVAEGRRGRGHVGQPAKLVIKIGLGPRAGIGLRQT